MACELQKHFFPALKQDLAIKSHPLIAALMGSWGRSAPGLAQGEARVATEHWEVEMTQHNSHGGAAWSVSFLARLITLPDVLIQSSCLSPVSKCDIFCVFLTVDS